MLAYLIIYSYDCDMRVFFPKEKFVKQEKVKLEGKRKMRNLPKCLHKADDRRFSRSINKKYLPMC